MERYGNAKHIEWKPHDQLALKREHDQDCEEQRDQFGIEPTQTKHAQHFLESYKDFVKKYRLGFMMSENG
jgi:hypothetical protein